MKVAHIIPPNQSQLFVGASHYHMALGQWLVLHPDYAKEYRRDIRHGSFVMVDNGAAEPEAERVSFEQIVLVALELRVDEIILPDVLRDGRATIYETVSAVEKYGLKVPPRMRCVVPQGTTWDEWFDCLTHLSRHVEFRTIGVAKHLEQLPGGRLRALELISCLSRYQSYDIHLLGVWGTDVVREIVGLRSSRVQARGIDTGAAVAYAQHKEWLANRCVLKERRRLDPQKHADVGAAIANMTFLEDTAYGV